MRRQILPAIRTLAVFTIVFGLAYPLVMTGIAQVLFGARANGSLVRDGSGAVVGSALIGQAFDEPGYFAPRPSAAGDGYDPVRSGASNLGPTNPALIDLVSRRVAEYRRANGLETDTEIPVDAVTASGSGLDPHISVANARLQAPRVARARNLDLEMVLRLVAAHTEGRSLAFLGEEGVNVLGVNLALDGVR